MIQSVRAGSATDFRKVFEWLRNFVNQDGHKISEMTVIFFTDGQDTCNASSTVQQTF